jgi:uncharacterized protein (TIGR02246 family)
MRATLVTLGILAAGLVLFGARSGEGQPPASGAKSGEGQPPAAGAKSGQGQPPAGGAEQAIRQAVAAYADAFNKGDLAALSAFWAPDAEYIDEAGTAYKGREAITTLFQRFLAEHKGAKMSLKVTNLRSLTADVALQDGTSAVTDSHGAVDEGRFAAVWFKADGKWTLRSVRDLPGESDSGAGAALKELQWLLGNWASEKGNIRVAARWALNRAYINLEYTVPEADGELAVMQLVGYDPLTDQIKSWTFDSRGGYGEALWQREGNSWVSQNTGVLPNGQTGTAVNVIRFVDDQTFEFKTRDREIGGQPLPDGELKLVRKPAAK